VLNNLTGQKKAKAMQQIPMILSCFIQSGSWTDHGVSRHCWAGSCGFGEITGLVLPARCADARTAALAKLNDGMTMLTGKAYGRL
jgi:hypothetical protein